jgi:hypothetical protein
MKSKMTCIISLTFKKSVFIIAERPIVFPSVYPSNPVFPKRRVAEGKDERC